MKIALVRPHHRTHLAQPALALGYLCGALRRRGHEVEVIDGLLERLLPEALAQRCEGADVVGISCLSDYHPQVEALCSALRPGGHRVVLGGPHMIEASADSFSGVGADFIVRGEGEDAMVALMDDLARGGDGEMIPGVGTPRHPDPAPRPLIADIDEIPFPDWSDCPPERYPKAPHGGVARRYPIAPIISSRGCPFDCSFCASPRLWERTIRFRSPENVLDEIEELVRRYGVREVHFEDDNLTLRRDHVAGIAEGLLRREIDVTWSTPNGIRCDAVDLELLQLMRRSGCYSVAFGIESANEEIRRQCGKQTSLAVIEAAIGMASKAGLLTQGFFVFGLPGETAETIEETIRFASRSALDKAQFLLLDVLPGTALWETVRHDLKEPGSYQSFHDPSWIPEGVAPEVLARAPGRAFRRFFLSRPRRLVTLARMIRPEQLPFIFRRLRDFRVLPTRR